MKKDMQDFNQKYMETDPNSRSVEENWNMIKKSLSDIVSENVPQKKLFHQDGTNHGLPKSEKRY